MYERPIDHFLVSSPLQVLGAFEARQRFGGDGQLIALHNNGETAHRQLRGVIEDTDWQSVIEVAAPDRGTLRRTRQIRKIATGIDSSAHVAFGDYSNRLMRHIVAQVTNPVLLDDGIGTRRVVGMRDGTIDKMSYTGKRSWLRHSAASILGLSTNAPTALTYFTYYDLQPGPHDRTVRHSFEATRYLHGQRPATGPIMFLGNCLVEVGLYAHDHYVDAVAAIAATFDEPLVYAPHRRESDSKLAAIERTSGATIQPADLPIELALLSAPQRPAAVTGFYSTAFHTLAVLLPDEIELSTWRLDDAGYRQDCQSSAQDVYDTMSDVTNGRVSVLQLPEKSNV